MLELRVLTGTHVGARALLSEDPQVLGSAGDCDLILSDEGVLARHLRIEPAPDGSILLRWEDEAIPPLQIGVGEGTTVGLVQVAIEEAGAPWTSDVTLRHPLRQEEHSTGTPDQGASPADCAQDPDRGPVGAAAEPGMATPAKTPRSRKTVTAGAGLLALALAGIGTSWHLRQARTNDARPDPPRPAASAAELGDLERTIRQLGMTDRVQVEARPGRPSAVKAVGLSDEESEVLAIALSRLVPRPALEVTSEQEFTSAVIDFVTRLAKERAPGLLARPLGDGRFAVAGRVADDKVRRDVQVELKQAFPQARGFEWQLLTPQEATVNLVEDLHAAGFDDVAGRWDEGAARLTVSLDESRVRSWETALARLAGLHDLPMRATMALRQPLRLRPGPPAPPVRSIVGGPVPYVVLADGRKLVAGGETDGWRLVDVQAGTVVFEGAGGRRVHVER